MNVILMGYRGSGKTTLGRALAQRLGRRFFDVDDEARARFDGRSVAAIWAREGEPAYRAAEVAVTRDLCGREGGVIALGGGTVMQPGGREAVAGAEALRVYLSAPASVLHGRIHAEAKSFADRPALTAGGGGLAEVRAVLAEREPVYRALADEVMDVGAAGMDEAIERLCEVVAAAAQRR